jgi:hypothetical protein
VVEIIVETNKDKMRAFSDTRGLLTTPYNIIINRFTILSNT